MHQIPRTDKEPAPHRSRLKPTIAAGLLLASCSVDVESTPSGTTAPVIEEVVDDVEPQVEQAKREKLVTYHRPSEYMPADKEIPKASLDDTTTTSSTSTSTTTTSTTLPVLDQIIPPKKHAEKPKPIVEEPVDETPKPISIDLPKPVDSEEDAQSDYEMMPKYEAPPPPFVMPEAEPMSPEIRQLLKENTVYIPTLGCSGYIVRGEDDKAIGAITAEHCGLRPDFRARKYDDQQRRYIENWGPITVQRGEDALNLETVAEVGSVIVSPEDDTSRDFALLVFKGEEPQEVYEALQPAPELQQGDTAYFSGWPLDQDSNPNLKRRQEFTLQYLGVGNATITNGDNLTDIRFFAMKSNDDGAECSFGASGSVAVNQDGLQIGTLASFDEFTPDTYRVTPEKAEGIRQWYESMFDVDLEGGYTNMCAFAPAPAFEDMEVYDVAENKIIFVDENTAGGIKGGETTTTTTTTVENNPEAEKEAFRMHTFEDVFNPDKEKVFVDGWMLNPAMEGGPETKKYIENPMIVMDDKGGAMLYWRDDNAGEGFGYVYYDNAADIHDKVTLYRIATENPATSLETVSGEVELFYDGFSDNKEWRQFGAMIDVLPENFGEIVEWSMEFIEGQWVFKPVENIHNTTTTTTTTLPKPETEPVVPEPETEPVPEPEPEVESSTTTTEVSNDDVPEPEVEPEPEPEVEPESSTTTTSTIPGEK